MTFIATEMKRIDSQNQEPAYNILKNDLDSEEAYSKIDRQFRFPIDVIFYVVPIISIILGISLIFLKWENIIDFFNQFHF